MTSQTEHEDIQTARRLLKNRRYKKTIALAKRSLKNYQDDSIRQHFFYILLSAYNQQDYLADAADIINNLPDKKTLSSEMLIELARYHQKTNDTTQAIQLLSFAQSHSPKDKNISIELGMCFNKIGDSARALQHFNQFAEQLDGINVNDNRMLMVLQKICNLQGLSAYQRSLLDESFSNTLKPSPPQSRMGFILAQDSLHQKKYSEESMYLTKANSMVLASESKTSIQWSADINIKKNQSLRELFPIAQPDWLPKKLNKNDDNALFILGLPESTAPLIEQLVCSNTNYVATGNSKALRTAMSKVKKEFAINGDTEENMFQRLQHCNTSFFERLSQKYSQHQHLASGNSSCYTDCLFSNALWVGLIANLFPNAKFIYARNDAPINCLNLLRKPTWRVPFSANPKHAAEAYYIYDKRMKYWKTLYPDRILEIDDCALKNELFATTEEIGHFLETKNLNIDDRVLSTLREAHRYHLHPLGEANSASHSDYKFYSPLLQPVFDVVALNENDRTSDLCC